jgi:hypothetical protein
MLPSLAAARREMRSVLARAQKRKRETSFNVNAIEDRERERRFVIMFGCLIGFPRDVIDLQRKIDAPESLLLQRRET